MGIIATDTFERGDGPIGGSAASGSFVWHDVFDEQSSFAIEGHLTMGWNPQAENAVDYVEALQHAPIPTILAPAQRRVSLPAQSFSRARVVGETATFPAKRRNLHHSHAGPVYLDTKRRAPRHANLTLQVAHYLLYLDLEQDDNIEVGVRWKTPSVLSTLSQVSPAGFIDPNAGPLEMGLVPIYDISLAGAMFIQNAFRNPENNVFDPDLYRILGYDGEMHPAVPPHPNGTAFDAWPEPGDDPTVFNAGAFEFGADVSHTIALRTSGDKIAMYLDGTTVSLVDPEDPGQGTTTTAISKRVVPEAGTVDGNNDPVVAFDVPTQYRGRTRWGIHVIAIQVDPALDVSLQEVVGATGFGALPGWDAPITDPTPSLISGWYAADFDEATDDWDDDLQAPWLV